MANVPARGKHGVWLLFAPFLWVLFTGEELSRPSFAAPVESPKSDPSTVEESALQKPARDPIQAINGTIAAMWEQAKLQPSAEEVDSIWCRRVFLDLLGRPPRVDEVQAFLKIRGKNRRTVLVDQLLGEKYAGEYAEFWADLWTNWMIGRSVDDNDGQVSREGLWKYNYASFLKNKPFDKFTHELLTAEGVNRQQDPKYNGAVNYLSGKVRDGGIQATDSSARLFLGVQVQCTQCHNHPFNKAKQNQFWEMNAFFRQTRALRREPSRDERYIELVDEDFVDETGDAEEAAVIYDLRNNKRLSAYPVFLDEVVPAPEKRPLASGRVSVVKRRKEYADRVIQSERFAKAQVNRVWAHFMGVGFTKPIDDMGPHNEPFSAELLDELAAAFRYQGYDYKLLLRWVVLSQPYGLSSQAQRKNELDDLTLGNPPRFSRFYSRQLGPEQLYNALAMAAGVETESAASVSGAKMDEAMVAMPGSSPSGEEGKAWLRAKERNAWVRQFARSLGNDDGAESTSFNGTVAQVLALMNGEMTQKAIRLDSGSFLQQLAWNQTMDNGEKIDVLFMAALARPADKMERAAADRILWGRKGDVGQALQDLYWALLNSNEFMLNH